MLSMTPGTFTSLEVTKSPTDPAVYGLGLVPRQIPTASVNGLAALPSNGRLSADATITVMADGGTATPLTITALSTSINSNQNQLLTQVQSALAPLNASLTAANRQPITVSLSSAGMLQFSIAGYGSTLQIVANTAAQAGLGLLPQQSAEAGAPMVSVTASAGPVPASYVLSQDASFAITVDGRSTFDLTVTAASTTANTTAQDLVDEIDSVLAPVNADLAGAGLPGVLVQIDSSTNHLVFITTGSASSIVVQGAAGNQLGIGTADASAAPMLTVMGSESFSNQIQLKELTLGGTLALTGSLAGTAQFGLVDIAFNQPAVSIGATVATGLTQTVMLSTLLASHSAIATYFVAPTLAGTASLTLPVSVSGAFGTSLGLPANAALTLNAADIFQLGSWTLDASKLGSLADLGSLSFSNIQSAFTQLGSAFGANGLLNEKIPMLNVSLGSLLGITQDFNAIAGDLLPGSNFTLDELQATLNAAITQAFGLVSGNYVTVGMSGNLLQLSLSFTPALQQLSLPMNFNFAALGLGGSSSLPGVSGFTGSNVTVTPSASINLVLDIDLTTPTTPIVDLDSATSLVLGLLIGSSSGISANLALGPVGLFVNGGTVELSSKESTSTPASFTVGVTKTTPLASLGLQRRVRRQRADHRDGRRPGHGQPADRRSDGQRRAGHARARHSRPQQVRERPSVQPGQSHE